MTAPIFCPLEPTLRECWVNVYTVDGQFSSSWQHPSQRHAIANAWRGARVRIHVIPKPGFEGVRLA